MAIVSKLSILRNDISLVLPEQEYHVLSCLHSTKMDALKPRKLC